jgi:hypothetical protein
LKSIAPNHTDLIVTLVTWTLAQLNAPNVVALEKRNQKMFHKVVTKLWQGDKVSVRDYEVKRAIDLGGLHLTYNNQVMTLTPDDLMKLEPEDRVYSSRTGGQNYSLVDILFKPDEETE